MKYLILWSFLLLVTSFLSTERLVESKSVSRPGNGGVSLNSVKFLGDEDSILPLPGDSQTVKPKNTQRKSLKLSREIRSLSQQAGQVSDEKGRSEAVLERMQALLPLMHYLAGPGVQIRQFINWDRTITINTVFYVRPETIWDVRNILRAATHTGLQARAAGTGHTRAPMYVDEGNIMIDITALEKHDGPRLEIHKPEPFTGHYVLTGVSSVIEGELDEYMKANAVTLLVQPLNNKETLGGIVALASHGSVLNAAAVSGYVVGMRIIDSMGRLRKFTEESHPELMKALKCNLGMMGIIYDISIKVYPAKKVKVENSFVKISDLFLNKADLKQLVENHYATEISWYPFNSVTDDEAEEYSKNMRVPSTWDVNNDLLWIRTFDEIPYDRNVPLKGIVYLPTKGSISGSEVKGLLRGRAAIALPKKFDTQYYQYLLDAFTVLNLPKHGKESTSAFVMNVDDDFDRPARAIQFMVNETEHQIRTLGITPFNGFLSRFIKNDDCYLCPGNTYIKQSNDTGHSIVIDILAPVTQQGFYPTTEKFAHHFKDDRVRPHWSKQHDNIKEIVNIMHNSYGKNFALYMQQRQLSGLDPTGVFMNSYLNEIFCTRGLANYCGYEG